MSGYKLIYKSVLISLLSFFLTSCYRQPPFNNFEPYNSLPPEKQENARGTYMGTEANLIRELNDQDIQFIRYGETMTMIVPADRYYIHNTPQLNDLCYRGLNNIIQMLKRYPKTTIYVAGFTDNVGTREEKTKLSQARAEAMLTFLWANGIQAKRLNAEGYADKHPVADNHLIHGSAQNRRVEIQWIRDPKIQYNCCTQDK